VRIKIHSRASFIYILIEENKNKVLREAAGDFALKASKFKSMLEIAIAGSVAGGDSYPGDLDVSIVVDSLDELDKISKYARQMSGYYHGWEVFLFDKNLLYLGRVCHRRECPSQSVDCYVPECGKPPHLRIHPGFKYNENIFLSSPFDILYTSFNKSRFFARRDELGITSFKKYPVLKDVKIKCIICGRSFVFIAGEQKWYKRRGFISPKRCTACREDNYTEI